MTPYLINRTWIDLDHVLAIEEQQEPTFEWDPSLLTVKVYAAFRDEPLEIRLGMWRDSGPAKVNEECRAKWAALIAAWKANRSLRDL